MKQFIDAYIKKYGYKPSIHEIYELYKQGQLCLTDKQENALLQQISKV